jgi:subfamily B ATP-binding cassette protein HlyB/CyaB
MARCGRKLGLKVRETSIDWTGLFGLRLPAVAALRDGGYLLLGQVVEDRIVAADFSSKRPKYMTRSELDAVWNGRIVAVVPPRRWKDFIPKPRLPKLSIPAFPGLRDVLGLVPRPRMPSLDAARRDQAPASARGPTVGMAAA